MRKITIDTSVKYFPQSEKAKERINKTNTKKSGSQKKQDSLKT